MAEWSSDSDPLGDLGAESEPAEQTLPKGKCPRPDDAGPSKIAKKKGKTGTRRAAPEIIGPVLSPTPLNIARPGFSMAKFTSQLPRAAGYAFSPLLFLLILPVLLCSLVLFYCRAARSVDPAGPGGVPNAPPAPLLLLLARTLLPR